MQTVEPLLLACSVATTTTIGTTTTTSSVASLILTLYRTLFPVPLGKKFEPKLAKVSSVLRKPLR